MWRRKRCTFVFLIGCCTRPSTLIPDSLIWRWRQWAGASKKIIRSFELRLLVSLSATMKPVIILMIMTMNGWWSWDQSRRRLPGDFEEGAAGRCDINKGGGDPSTCVSPCAFLCQADRAAVKSGGRERVGGATRLACKPIKVELHTTTFTFGISAYLHAVKEVQGM